MPLWLISLGAVAWGAIWGSFANVVVHRWPRGLSLARPGSRCPACGHPIRWYDNVPLLSWLLLGARCRDCGAGISMRYPLVEATSALLAGAVWYKLASDALLLDGRFDPSLMGRFLVEFQVLWGLMVVALVDLETLLVPDVIVLPLTALALLGQWMLPGGELLRHALAAAAGYLLVYLLFVLGWRLLTGREGMGLGDGKILALLGAQFGPLALPLVLVLAAVQGLVYVAVVMGLLGRSPTPPGADEPPARSVREVKVPFGPFLALGAIEAALLAPLAAVYVADWPLLHALFAGW
ncbi:MAG: prepilin peptidase [Deltaproteobacteria bacterium]|nr:prepilin peptidase [Deltaproteobacteria bacterium]